MCKKENHEAERQELKSGTIVIAGFAALPEEIALGDSCRYVAVEFEVNSVDLSIVDVTCTLSPFVVKEILDRACLGNKLEVGIEKAITQLNKRFFGVAKETIINALEDAHKWYKKSPATND